MVLEGRLELPRIAPLAPQASASAIPPLEHIALTVFRCRCHLIYTDFFICQAKIQKKIHFFSFFFFQEQNQPIFSLFTGIVIAKRELHTAITAAKAKSVPTPYFCHTHPPAGAARMAIR